jgi:hypothetical protein
LRRVNVKEEDMKRKHERSHVFALVFVLAISFASVPNVVGARKKPPKPTPAVEAWQALLPHHTSAEDDLNWNLYGESPNDEKIGGIVFAVYEYNDDENIDVNLVEGPLFNDPEVQNTLELSIRPNPSDDYTAFVQKVGLADELPLMPASCQGEDYCDESLSTCVFESDSVISGPPSCMSEFMRQQPIHVPNYFYRFIIQLRTAIDIETDLEIEEIATGELHFAVDYFRGYDDTGEEPWHSIKCISPAQIERIDTAEWRTVTTNPSADIPNLECWEYYRVKVKKGKVRVDFRVPQKAVSPTFVFEAIWRKIN